MARDSSSASTNRKTGSWGRVKEAGPDVHQIAVQWLQQNNPQPTELHRNLLRLYSKNEGHSGLSPPTSTCSSRKPPTACSMRGQRYFRLRRCHWASAFKASFISTGPVSEPAETVLTNLDFGASLPDRSRRLGAPLPGRPFRQSHCAIRRPTATTTP